MCRCHVDGNSQIAVVKDRIAVSDKAQPVCRADHRARGDQNIVMLLGGSVEERSAHSLCAAFAGQPALGGVSVQILADRRRGKHLPQDVVGIHSLSVDLTRKHTHAQHDVRFVLRHKSAFLFICTEHSL